MKTTIRIISLVLASLIPLPNATAMTRPTEYFSPSVELPMPSFTPQQSPELQGYLPSYLMPSKILVGLAGAYVAAITTYITYKQYQRYKEGKDKVKILTQIFANVDTDVTTLLELLWLFNNAYTHNELYKNIFTRAFTKQDLDLYIKYNQNFMQQNTTGIKFLQVTSFPKVKYLLAKASLLKPWLWQSSELIKNLELKIIGVYKAINAANQAMQGWIFTPNKMNPHKLAEIVAKVALTYNDFYKTLLDIYNNLDIDQKTLTVPFIDSIGADRTIHKIYPLWLASINQNKEIENLLRERSNQLRTKAALDDSRTNQAVIAELLPAQNKVVLTQTLQKIQDAKKNRL